MYKWISEGGQCSLSDIISLIDKLGDEKRWFIAMLTDGFVSREFKPENINKVLKNQLLEVRIFNENSELLVTRGSIGEDFQWRITSDDGLDNADYIDTYQFIDINEHMTSYATETGNLDLISTVGGRYSLPITDSQKRVKIKSYVSYDHNGMAKVVDARVCCFTE